MTYQLKPKLPTGATYGSGQITFPTTNIEVSSDFKNYVETIDIEIRPMYIMKYDGFDAKKYKAHEENIRSIDIMLVGNLPRFLHEQLYQLAIATNGAGIAIEFYDDFATGTDASPISYTCRWVNAGDFVESNVIQNGGSIQLIAFDAPEDVVFAEYQETIDVPASTLDWQENIAEQTENYLEVIGN